MRFAFAFLFVCACGSSSSSPTTTDGGGTTTTPKTTCAPACGASEVCMEPGACSFDAKCIARSDVTCPDGGLCSTTGCAGELDGGTLHCVCR